MALQRRTQTGSGANAWSDDEHNLLVQMTNDQLRLEGQDSSTIISWNFHWKRVALRLREAEFSRTAGACREYWKRQLLELHDNDVRANMQKQNNDIPNTEGEESVPDATSSPNKRPLPEDCGHSADGLSPEPKKNRAQYIRDATEDRSVSPGNRSRHN
jgi:hypothetical protein